MPLVLPQVEDRIGTPLSTLLHDEVQAQQE